MEHFPVITGRFSAADAPTKHEEKLVEKLAHQANARELTDGDLPKEHLFFLPQSHHQKIE